MRVKRLLLCMAALMKIIQTENNTDILSIHNDIQLNVKKVISNFKAIHMDGAVSTKLYYIFVPDFDEVAEKLAQ